MAKQTICNWCGKIMNSLDRKNGVSLYSLVGYGSTYDGQEINLDLCPLCTTEFINLNNQKCKISLLQ